MFYYKSIFENNHFSVLGATLWVSDITSLGIIQLCYRNFNVHGCSTICTLSCPADNYRLANFRSDSSQRNHRNRIHRDGKQLLKNKIRHMFNFNQTECFQKIGVAWESKFYFQGGLKTVVWSDLFQSCIMFATLTAIIVKATQITGNFDEVWKINLAMGRVEWTNWDPSPFVRNTSLGIFFGQFFLWAAIFSSHQTQVQRYCATPSLHQARM